MVLFITLIGIAKLKSAWRVATESAICVFAIYSGRRDVLMFIGGMLLADLDLMRRRKQSQLNTTRTGTVLLSPSPLPSRYATIKQESFWLTIFVAGLYSSSVAVGGPEHQLGYGTLIRIARTLFWGLATDDVLRVTGALLTTWAAANSTLINPIFTNRFSQYLGKISYALYIVHGNTLKLIQYPLLPHLYRLVGTEGPDECGRGQIVLVHVLGLCIVLPLTLWAADLVWRAVDKPSVKFAHWVKARAFRD